MSRVFTADQLATLRRQYETGTVIAELAEAWEHAGLTIYRALKEAGATFRSRGDRYASEVRNAAIQARRYAGETPAVLCADYGLTPGRLEYILSLPPITETTLTRSDLDPDEEQRVVDQYLIEELTIAEIAAAWKIGRARIDAVLNRRGIPRRNRGARPKAPPPPADPAKVAREVRDAEILRRARAGQSRMQIVDEMGLTIGVVYNVLGSLGADELARLYPTPAKPRRTAAPRAKRIERVRPAAPPKAPRTASDISPKATAPTMITHRTCPRCGVSIRLTNWLDHMDFVHDVSGKRRRQQLAEDAAVNRVRLEHTPDEPARPPEPDCPICRQKCLAPLSHGRILRARAQHKRKKAA